MHRASATHVAELIHAFNERGFAALDPRRGGGRPRRIDADQRAAIVKVALARPADLGEPFTDWSLTKLRAHLLRERVVPAISRSQLWRILHEARHPLPAPQDLEGLARSRLRGQEEPRPRPLRPSARRVRRVLCLDEFGPAQPPATPGARLAAEQASPPASGRPTGAPRGCATCSPPTTRRPGGCTATSGRPRPGARCASCCARCGPASTSTSSSCSTTSARTTSRSSCDWAAEHDIELVYLPTYSSWLNLIECQFQALRRFTLNGHRLREPRRAGRRHPCLPALAQPQRPARQALAHQGRGASFAPERCGMRH